MVTIGIVNHNCHGLIELLVLSILKKTDNLEKLIIVDNGSTDGSLDLLPKLKKIQIIRRQQKLPGASNGKGEGLNVLKDLVQTKYGAFFENDTFILMEHWDTRLKEYLEKTSKIFIGSEFGSKPKQLINGQFTCGMFFNNEEFRKYNINFMPKGPGTSFHLNTDAGWEMHEKIHENLAEKFDLLSCRKGQGRIFKGPHSEYLFEDEVFFAHYGRGSLVKNKKGKKYDFIGEIGSKILRKIFKLYKFELKRWRRECFKRL